MSQIVTHSETYDLSTKVGKMGMLGIHTPSMDVISREWAGLVENHRKIKILKCDVAIACASMQSSDPLQVGIDSDQVAPQDLFNPILYTAVSNDSFGTLQARLHSLGYFAGATTSSVDMDQSPLPDNADDFGVYYSLLADEYGFRKAMPQAGLAMSNLRPLVHAITATGAGAPTTGTGSISGYLHLNDLSSWYADEDGNKVETTKYFDFVKGPTIPMPAVPTMMYDANGITGHTDQYPSSLNCSPTKLPKCYVGCVITPPAKQNVLYYRMKVRWTIEFSDLRPLSEIKTLTSMAWDGNNRFYYSDYDEQSSKMAKVLNTVDTVSVDATQIM